MLGADPDKQAGSILHSSVPWIKQMWDSSAPEAVQLHPASASLLIPSAMLSSTWPVQRAACIHVNSHILGFAWSTALAVLDQSRHFCSRRECKPGKEIGFIFSLLFSNFFGGPDNESKLQFCRNTQNIYSIQQNCTVISETQKVMKPWLGFMVSYYLTHKWFREPESRKAVGSYMGKQQSFRRVQFTKSLLFSPFFSSDQWGGFTW